MLDAFFIGLTLLFFLATYGLILLCDRLLKGAR
jgi:hypothetical protein